MKTLRTYRRPLGFTLVEVVIALAVFAGATVGFTMTSLSIITAREHGVTNDLLDADLRAVRMQLLLEANIEDAEEGGELDTLSNGEAIWSASIEPTNVVDLFKVQFQVEFSEPFEDGPADYQETLYLLRPTWSESDERADLLADKREELRDNRNFGGF